MPNPYRFAIVAGRFNAEITEGLVAGARRALDQAGVNSADVPIFQVPGAFEIPLAAKKLAQTRRFDAIVAIGCVIKGETSHFEYICQWASTGIGQVGLETGVPVTFGVLTVLTEEQAMARCGENSENKGFEAATAAVEMVRLLHGL